MCELGGSLDIVITARRAETLRARAYDGDVARVIADGEMTLVRAQAVADPALALRLPMIGPFRTRRDGSADAHRMAVRLSKAARLLPCAFVAPVANAAEIAKAEGLTFVDQETLAASEAASTDLSHVASARVPLSVSEDARVHVWRPASGEEEHYAIEIGSPDRTAPVLARLHSACFTGI